MLRRKKFISCTVFLSDNNSQSVIGSVRKQKQGLELEYTYDTKNERAKLEAVLVVGFANQTSVPSSQITTATCGFIGSGKTTLQVKNKLKILLSNASESELVGLVNDLEASNPSLVVLPKSLSKQQQPAATAANCHQPNSAAAAANQISSQLLIREEKTSSFREKRRVVASSGAASEQERKLKRSRKAFNITRPAIANEEELDDVDERLGAAATPTNRSIVDVLNDDVLTIILSRFGMEPRISEVCKDFNRLSRACSQSLTVRPYQVSRDAAAGCCCWSDGSALAQLPQPSLRQAKGLHIDQIIKWVICRPQLRSLDLSNYSSITPKGLQQLISHNKFPRDSLKGIRLRNAAFLNDVSIRGLLHRLHALRRIDLVNIPSISFNALTPLRPGLRLNGRLECLWLGMKSDPTREIRTNDQLDDKVLEFLLDSETANKSSAVFAELINKSCPPPPLLSLSLSNCPNIQRLPFIDRIGSTLIELDISGTGVTDEGFAAACAAALGGLKCLSVAGTKIGNLSLRALRHFCSNIEVIDLSDLSRGLDSSNFFGLHVVWPKLRKLKVARLQSFTDHCLGQLLFSTPAALSVLDITGCQNASILFAIDGAVHSGRVFNPPLVLCIGSTSLYTHSLKPVLRDLSLRNIIIDETQESQLFNIPNIPLYDFNDSRHNDD